MKKCGLILMGILSCILFFMSMLIGGLFKSLYAANFYAFTLPFIIMSGLCAGLAMKGLFDERFMQKAYRICIIFQGLLILPFGFAIYNWPGGDDGPGMAWVLVIGSGSIIALTMAILFSIISCILILVKRAKYKTA